MAFYTDWLAKASNFYIETIARQRVVEQARITMGTQLPEQAAIDGALAEAIVSARTAGSPFQVPQGRSFAGVAGDGVTDDRAGLLALDATKDYELSPATYLVATSMAFTTRPRVRSGVLFKPMAGANIHFAKGIRARDAEKCIDLSLGGTVSWGQIEEVDPRWFGAKGDSDGVGGGTDDSVALQAWVDSLGQRQRAIWPPSFYSKTTVPLRVWAKREVRFEMSAQGSWFPDATVGIDFRGANGKAAVQMYNCIGTRWIGIKVFFNNGAAVDQIAIDIDKFDDGTVIDGHAIVGLTSSDCAVMNTCLQAQNNTAASAGVRIAYISANNVENMLIEDTQVSFNQNQTDATNVNRGVAFLIGTGGGGANAKNIRFHRVQSVGCRSTVKASGGSSYTVEEGESQRSTIDFDSPSSVTRISRFRPEYARQFFVGARTVTLIANEIANGSWDPAYPIVKMTGTGVLTMIGNEYDDDGLGGAGAISVDADQSQNSRFVGVGNHWRDNLAPNLSHFADGATDIGGKQGGGLALLIAGVNPGGDIGTCMRLKDGTTLANLGSVDNGTGTILWCTNAQPGNDDATVLGDSSQFGGGSLLVKIGTKWAALATNLFKLLKWQKPGGGYVAPVSAADTAWSYYSDGREGGVKVSENGRAYVRAFPLFASTPWDPPNVAAGSQDDTKTITVPGAVIGDQVLLGFSLSLQKMFLVGYVEATDTVRVVLRNGTAGALDLANGTLSCRVFPN